MGREVRLVALPLLDLVDLEPGLLELEVVAGVGEVEDDLLLLALEGAGDVLESGVEGVLLGLALQLVLFVLFHALGDVGLLAPLHDGGGGEAEAPAWGQNYLERLLATVKTVLIILMKAELMRTYNHI